MTGRNPNGQSRAETELVEVVVGRLDPLLAQGMAALIRQDPRLRLGRIDVEPVRPENAAISAPRVVVVDDIVVPGTLERLKNDQPQARVLVLAHNPTRAYGMGLLAAGAACVARNASVREILDAVHLVAQGTRVFLDADGQRVERGYPLLAELLTPRELEVLELLSKGRKPGQIALTLKISFHTARRHAANIRSKLGVHSNQELIGIEVPASVSAHLAG